jgi:predicted RNA-binding protein with PUA-like domain
VAEVSREGYPDHTARDPTSGHYDEKATDDDPRWFMVDIRFVRMLPRTVPLDELKADEGLEGMVVTTRSRLSVQPVQKRHFEHVLTMADTRPAR